MLVNNNVGRFASGAVIILNNNIDRYWSRYYTKQHGWSLSPLEPFLFSTTILVAAGAVNMLNSHVGRFLSRFFIINNKGGRYWSRYYTKNQC